MVKLIMILSVFGAWAESQSSKLSLSNTRFCNRAMDPDSRLTLPFPITQDGLIQDLQDLTSYARSLLTAIPQNIDNLPEETLKSLLEVQYNFDRIWRIYRLSQDIGFSGELRSEQILSFFEAKLSEIQSLVASNPALIQHVKKKLESSVGVEKIGIKNLLVGDKGIFSRGGQGLQSEEIEKTRVELSKLETQYAQLNRPHAYIKLNLEDLEGLSRQEISRIPYDYKTGKYALKVNFNSARSLLTSLKIESTRKLVFESLGPPNKNSRETVKDVKSDNLFGAISLRVVDQRNKLAHIRGAPHYGAWIQEERVFGSVSRYRQFLENLVLDVTSRTQTLLNKIEKKHSGLRPLEPWNILYYERLYKTGKNTLSDRDFQEHFPFESTFQGTLGRFEELFGIKFEHVPHVKSWGPHVRIYKVVDVRTQAVLAAIHFDLFEKEGKHPSAWAESLQIGANDFGETPIVVVSANFSSSDPFLSHRHMIEIFHEMGHAMHFVFAQNPKGYPGFGKFDFVEFPSTLMELFLDTDFLVEQSRHPITGKPLTPKVIKEYLNSQTQLYWDLSLTAYCLLDFYFHTQTSSLFARDKLKVENAWQLILDHEQKAYQSFGFPNILFGPRVSRLRSSAQMVTDEYAFGMQSYVVGRRLSQRVHQWLTQDRDHLQERMQRLLALVYRPSFYDDMNTALQDLFDDPTFDLTH